MRIILYLGKGGVGKTTVAAASALRSAALGFRTLVVSTDIAHSLSDSFDVRLQGEAVKITDHLYAQEINVLDEIRTHWGSMQGYVSSLLRRQGMSSAIADELAIIPGMEEVVSLLHINREAKEGNYDRVIVDAAPTGETIRLLSVPESFQWYASRMLGWGDTTLRMANGLLRRFMPDKDPFQGLNNLVEGVHELQGVLLDNQITSYRVVLNPEKMVIKEGARAVSYLSLFGYPVDAVIVNRILPGIEWSSEGDIQVGAPSIDSFMRGLQETQAAYLADIQREFFPLPILRAVWSEREMLGIERLSHLAEALFGEQDPGQVFFVGRAQEIEEEGDDLILSLPLATVEIDKVQLRKRGDELFVRIGNFRRELLLPAALAQRDASGATFTDGILRIRFPQRVGTES